MLIGSNTEKTLKLLTIRKKALNQSDKTYDVLFKLQTKNAQIPKNQGFRYGWFLEEKTQKNNPADIKGF